MKRILGFLGFAALMAFAGTGAYGAEQTLTVNQAWAGKPDGESVEGGGVIGTTAFATIQAAVEAADVSQGAVTIKVKAGTYTGDQTRWPEAVVSFLKYEWPNGDVPLDNLKFSEGGKDWYGRLHFVGEEGAVISGKITTQPGGGEVNFADITVEGFTFVESDQAIYIDNNTRESKNITIKNNTFNFKGAGPYVICAVIDGLTVTGNHFNSTTGNNATLGGNTSQLKNVTVSGNTFANYFGLYGQVLEGVVVVSDNTFTGGCDEGFWINNTKGANVGSISFSGNTVAGTYKYVLGFSTKYGKKTDIMIGEGNTFGGEPITDWAVSADDGVIVNANAAAGEALYYDHLLYLGDETAFKTPAAAVAGREEPVTILNYNQQMEEPEGWKFVTDESGTKLVKKVYVAKIGDDGYETLEEAYAKVPAGGTITLIADVTCDSKMTLLTSFTLDLGQHTLSLTKGMWIRGVIKFTNGKVDISSAVGDTFSGNASYNSAFFAHQGSTFNLEGVEIVGNGTPAFYPIHIGRQATFTVDNSRITLEEIDNGLAVLQGSVTTIKNGSKLSFTNLAPGSGEDYRAINCPAGVNDLRFGQTTLTVVDSEILIDGGERKGRDGVVQMMDFTLDNSILTLRNLVGRGIHTCTMMTLKNNAQINIEDTVVKEGLYCGVVCEGGSKIVNACPNGATLFTGSKFESDSIFANPGVLNIKANASAAIETGADVTVNGNVNVAAGASLSVGAGKYLGEFTVAAETSKIDLTGGYYKEEPADEFVNPAYQKKQNTDEPMLSEGYLWKIGVPSVAKIGDVEYETISEAFAAVNTQAGDDVTIKILRDVTETLTADYYFSKNLVLSTDVEAGVTVDLVNKNNSILANKSNGVLKIEEGVKITNLCQLFAGYGAANATVDIYGRVESQQMWAYYTGVVNVYPSGSVWLGYGDGMLKMRYDSTVNLEGALAEGAAATLDLASERQLFAGYVSGDYTGKKYLNFANTYAQIQRIQNSGSGTFATTLDNAVLLLSDDARIGYDTGAASTGTLTLKNGSRMITDKLVLNANDTASVEMGSLLSVAALANGGKIAVDMKGAVSASAKVVDYTGSGTMTLDAYGNVSVENTSSAVSVYVEDNDLYVKVTEIDKCQAKIVNEDGSVDYYATFAEAVAAAEDGGTISVNRAIAEEELVEIANKSVKIDLAGQTVKANISFKGTAEEFVIDSVGGGKVLGEILVDVGCTLKIRAGLYANDPSAWFETDETGRKLYVAILEDGLYKVQENQIEIKTPDPENVTVTDENGNPVPDEELPAAAAAIAEANEKLQEIVAKNSAFDTGIAGAVREMATTPSGELVPGPVKPSIVAALKAAAPAEAKPLITSACEISERLVIDISAEAAVVKTVSTVGELKKDAIFTSITYDVKPIVTAIVKVGDATVKVEMQLSNDEITKPLKFRLAVLDPRATGAYVRHVGQGGYQDETSFGNVLGESDERYVESASDHFSLFEVRTTSAIIEETADAVGIINLGVPVAGKEFAAAVPFLKSGVEGTEATLADLIVTGRANGDTVTFQKDGATATLDGDVWNDSTAKTPGAAFWYKSAGSDVPLTLAGLVTDPITTAEAGSVTLFVNPYNSAQDIFAAVGAAAAEGDQITLVGGDVRYVKTAAGWGAYVKSLNNTEADGVYVENTFVPAATLAVDGGKGVWYISKNGAPTVTWSAEGAASESEQIADGTIPTFGALAWGVALDAEQKNAFNPKFARLVVYEGNEEIGGYTRQLADGQLADTLTTFLGADGWTWSDVADAQFAVRLLDNAKQKIVESDKVGLDDLAANLAMTYAGSTAPTVATATYKPTFNVVDSGEFEALKEIFAGKGIVTKTADGYLVTLTDNMDGAVELTGGLGNVKLDLHGHTIKGADGTAENTVGCNAIEIVGVGPGTSPTVLTVFNGDPKNFAQIAGGRGASSASGFNGGTAIFVDPALAAVRVNVKGPNAESDKPLVLGGDAGISYVSGVAAAGLAITAANVGEVAWGMTSSGAAGELHTAWAWCEGAATQIDGIVGFETDATGTNWFFRTAENGGAAFDFAALNGHWTGDRTIHFVAGEINVDGLVDMGFGGDLTFVGEGAGETMTTLKAISESSVFAVSGVTAKRVWKNLAFTDNSTVADKADGGAISMVGGSLAIEGCSFENCVGGEFGGAVFASLLEGDSTITNSTFVGNHPLADGTGEYDENGAGGAVYATAAGEGVKLAIADSVFEGNQAFNGGAIYAITTGADAEKPIALDILRVKFTNNAANGTIDSMGGAIATEGAVTIDAGNVTVDPIDGLVYAGEPTVFSNNTATGLGGAIVLTGVGVNESRFEANRGVIFVDNAVENEYSSVAGGAIAAMNPGATIAVTGVEFRGNKAKGNDMGYLSAYGGALVVEDAASLLIDTCVFNDNDAIDLSGESSDSSVLGAGAVDIYGVADAVVKNSTFRYSDTEAVYASWSTVAVTNCVLVDNGEGGYNNAFLYKSAANIAYTAYEKIDFEPTGADVALVEAHNLTNCVPEKVYKAETLRLNDSGFNPVAALGIQQYAYDFVGVKYGSKNIELGGSSMGAYETGFKPLNVLLTGNKVYDGTTTSNGCTWAWKLTDENWNETTWDELGNVDEAFTIASWTFGKKDHGYYASTNAAPMTVTAELEGAEDLRFALKFYYEGTISRRDVELGGMLVETIQDEYEYTGAPIEANVTVTDTNANVTLERDVDYILSFTGNVNPTAGAEAIVEGINNYKGTVSTNYFITAYYVEYSFDGEVDDTLTKIYGKLSDNEVFAQELPENLKPAGYAFDAHHSPTNGVVYRYGESGLVGASPQLVLQVQYYTDSNGDNVPDRYQKRMKMKIINGEWDGEKNGRDKDVWVTLTGEDGLWSTTGTGTLAAAPEVGHNAYNGYAANKYNQWLTIKNGQLVLVSNPASFEVSGDSIPFFLYAYLKGGKDRGRGASGNLDLAGRYGIQAEATGLTLNPAKKLATISVKVDLIETASGATVTGVPLEGSSVKAKVMEALNGPAEEYRTPVNGDSTITVPADGSSMYYQFGL